MPKDKRIGSYIAKSKPFARPILMHLRAVVHAAYPHGEETIRRGFPHFYVNGKPLVGMAASNERAAFNVWRAELPPKLQALRQSCALDVGRQEAKLEVSVEKARINISSQAS